jgi:sialidase-1
LFDFFTAFCQTTLISTATVYKMGENGYHSFRIPAIILAADHKTLLAFAEGRKNSRSDTGDIDLLLKRSTDGGRTWSEIIIVWDDAENVCGNPSPVVDVRTGKIVLLATWNLGSDHEKDINKKRSKDTRRVFMLTSADNGASWSQPAEITKMTKKNDWTWYATGPCHAIQLTKGKYKGRIVVPCDHAYLSDTMSVYRSHLIYSDDLGKSWHIGGISADDGNESSVVELSDGTLMLNMRSSGKSREKEKCRLVAISKDGGESLGETKFEKQLSEPVCQGSILNYLNGDKITSKLLFSNPSNPDKRRGMTIKLSMDNGTTWNVVYSFEDVPAAYSDLVVLPTGNVGILYENGLKRPTEQINFDVLSL